MKKLRKIILQLNKEVVSNLADDNLNQIKGGASDMNSYVYPCCSKPISVPAFYTCECPAASNNNCAATNINTPCILSVNKC